MAELRVKAVVLAMLCTTSCRCGSEEKKPAQGSAALASGLAAPIGWQPLPPLAAAARQAAGVTVLGSEAWADTTRGCYASWLAMRGAGAAPDRLAEQLLKSITGEPTLAGVTVRDVVKPSAGADNGVLAFGFERGVYRGKVRAMLARDGKVVALACFWNQREPAACEQACTHMIGSMR